MFGYVTPIKDELKVKEFEIFRGYYCGICTVLGKINYPSKYLLNYDVTFLALLLSSLEFEKDYPKRRFCPYTIKRVKYYSNEFIKYGAIINVLLANRKLLDNYYDEKNYLYLILSKIIRLKDEDGIKSKVEEIDKHLFEITKLERQNTSDIDKLSHHFGKITETLFDVFDDKRTIALKYFGYNLGRWIYVIDALDDLKRDLKSGEYNPLKLDFDEDTVRFTLYSYLENITKAYELLDFKKNKGILDNIVYLGLADKTEKVLKGENKNEKSIRGFGCEGERFIRGDKESI
ncbi:hypothetical protein ABG79_01732 [Caloramator mitchellensis]|uniref:Uncharacterized protein n=1 Tax=Caloramator mitchellensis TaxID=908809 RepID=A0A0R3JSS4_CALMK|nr:DUF5685 family protein [Caloramator mitchellensis]KRQ86523.1 hypothetical protein ABG79_01732 [Caloramator mitchellensis]